MEWSRFAQAGDVASLSGVWRNTEGATCTVADGDALRYDIL